MIVDDKLISKLEKLSRLALDDKERGEIKTDLKGILEMVEKLEELDLSDVEPLLHISPVAQRVRQDEIGNHLSIEQALQNAPTHEGHYFTVPKVIKR